MPLLLGIDLGTSYFKVGLFDETGRLRGLGRVAVEAQRPATDRMELAVDAFWARLRAAFFAALNQSGGSANDIAGVSYSSQANTLLLLDQDDQPLTPLVFWPDRRAHPLPASVVAFGESAAHVAKTGLFGVVAEQAPAKWQWVASHEPGVWRRTCRALTISDYVTYALTGEQAGDASTAALTGLYDLAGARWWPEALAAFGLNEQRLARPVTPGTQVGRTGARASELMGLPAEIPFAVGALDHHAAAMGAGIGSLADASMSIGTVLAILALVDEVRPAPGCIHGPHSDGRRFYRLAYDATGAGQLEIYQRQSAPALDIAALLRLAEDGAGEHTRPVREILDRVAVAQAALLDLVVAGGAQIRKVAATGGGARSQFWLQKIAEAVRRPIVTPECVEPGCLGAAIFASVAAGVHRDIPAAAKAMVRRASELAPR